jgi:hypothetical protein
LVSRGEDVAFQEKAGERQALRHLGRAAAASAAEIAGQAPLSVPLDSCTRHP